MRLAFHISLLLVLSSCIYAHAGVIHVPGDQPTIQSGVDAAVDGDSVLVAAGVYSGPGNFEINLSMRVISIIGVEGSAATQIDCADGGRAFLAVMAEDTTYLIQGFTISNGQGSGSGGALFCYEGRPSLRDLLIENCVGTASGGGILLQNVDFLDIAGLTLDGCQAADDGGGLYMINVGNAVLDDVSLSGCHAGVSGGGLHCENGAAIEFSNLLVSDCAVDGGGGGICFNESFATFDGGLVHGNVSALEGAGVLVMGVSQIDMRQVDVVDNGNGGIYCEGPLSRVQFENGIIAFNHGEQPGVRALNVSVFNISCSDIFANTPSNFGGGIPNQIGSNGNITGDPLFCDLGGGNLSLALNSPCLPENNDCHVLMGHLDLGCQGETHVYRVPDDFPTIQAAVDACLDGYSVVVAPGVYTGEGNKDIDLGNRDMTLIGEGGSDVTVIDCEGSGRGFFIHSNSEELSFRLEGFSIVNGDVTGDVIGVGGGIFVDWASFTMMDIRIHDCEAYSGGGMFLSNVFDSEISGLWIEGCSGQLGGGGALYCGQDVELSVSGALIRANNAEFCGGISAYLANLNLSGITLTENQAPALFGSFSQIALSESIIAFNTGNEAAIWWQTDSDASIACVNVYGNQGGGYGWGLDDQTGINGNISADPLFCDPDAGVFELAANSPCLPENNDCGLLMGAFEQGCGELYDYLISGRVLDTQAEPLADLPLLLDDGQEVRTDAEGDYSLLRRSHWSGTLTPSHPGYTFAPPSRTYSDLAADQPEQDFTGTRLPQPHHVPGTFPDIQAALDFALPGDTILVAPGTYRLADLPQGAIHFLGKDVALIGSGGAEQTIIDCSAGNHSNSGIKILGGESRDLLIQGFTLAGSSHTTMEFGAASSATLRDCVFEEIFSHESYFGGGVVVGDGCSPLFEDCVFRDNSHIRTALWIDGGSPEIQSTLFTGNTGRRGGAVQILGGTPVFSDVVFRDNIARRWATDMGEPTEGRGGAVYCDGESAPLFERCLFSGNLAELSAYHQESGYGGAVFIGDTSSPAFSGCTFADNRAELFQLPRGGQICHAGTGTLLLEDVVIAFGGGGGGIVGLSTGQVSSINCDVFGNIGGAYIGLADPTGDDCNIAADPLFCDSPNGDFTLNAASPCLAANNPCAVTIGLHGQGCDEAMLLISGRVTRSGGQGQADVELRGGPSIAFSDGDGHYTFHVPPGWSGAITPWKGNMTFTPATLAYTDVQEDLPDQDYAASLPALIVPDDYATIQEAIAAAYSGDSILVKPGVYVTGGFVPISFGGKDIVVHAPAGPDSTFIEDSTYWPMPAIWFDGHESAAAELSGFTLRGEDGDYIGEGICFHESQVTLRDMVFDTCGGNWSEAVGAITISDSAPLISGCVFRNNRARRGGAIILGNSASPVIENCLFIGNSAGEGGAIHGSGMELRNCVFRDNHASDEFSDSSTGIGGAVYGHGVFTDVVFENCSAYTADIYQLQGCGGAVFQETGSSSFTRVSFLACASDCKGGGLYVGGGSVELSACTFAGNSAFLAGGALAFAAADLSLDRCLVAFNGDMGGLWADPTQVDDQSFAITCSDVFGNVGGDYAGSLEDQTGLEDNIAADPLFCDFGEGDLALGALSPCLPWNNDCGLQMGAFGQGCIDTPVLLAGFDAESEPGAITLRWELGAAAAAPDFRLEARQGESLRELDWRATDPGGFEARDELPADCAGEEISYSLFGRDGDEDWFPLGELSVIAPEQVLATRLLAPFPNPFNPKVTISFTLAEAGKVRVSIFDITGRRVARLADENFESGRHELVWTGRDNAGHVQSSGIYFLSMEASGYSERRRLVLLR